MSQLNPIRVVTPYIFQFFWELSQFMLTSSEFCVNFSFWNTVHICNSLLHLLCVCAALLIVGKECVRRLSLLRILVNSLLGLPHAAYLFHSHILNERTETWVAPQSVTLTEYTTIGITRHAVTYGKYYESYFPLQIREMLFLTQEFSLLDKILTFHTGNTALYCTV